MTEDDSWRVDQWVYFYVASESLTAAQLTVRIGLPPDQVNHRGATSADPPQPPDSTWQIDSDRPGRLEQQTRQVLDRIRPFSRRIRELVEADVASAGLTLVRYFDSESGIASALGWWLDPDQIELLAGMGAGIQSDEYGG